MSEQWLIPVGYYAGQRADARGERFAVRLGQRMHQLDSLDEFRVWRGCGGARRNGAWRTQRPDVEGWLVEAGVAEVSKTLDGLIDRGLVRQVDDDAQAVQAATDLRIRPLLVATNRDPSDPTRFCLGFSVRQVVACVYPGEYALWRDGPAYGSLGAYLRAVVGAEPPSDELWAVLRAAGALYGADAGYLDLADGADE